jgi:hypothetical protein
MRCQTFRGTISGKPAEFVKALESDIFLGATVYCRHHSGYIPCKVVRVGVGGARLQTPSAARDAWLWVDLAQIFVKVQSLFS